MCRPEREFRPIVVKWFDAGPCRLGMTIVARIPETPLMRILSPVAVDATFGGVAELYRLRVTVAARHRDMSVAKREIRRRMFEGLAVELYDVGIAPLVIGMAIVAFLFRRPRIASMKSPTGLAIGGNVLVTGGAEPRLRSWRKRLVTVAALLFELGMSGREWPGHDELLEQVLCFHCGCYAGHTDPDHKRLQEFASQ